MKRLIPISQFVDEIAPRLPEFEIIRIDTTTISGADLMLTGINRILVADKFYEIPCPVFQGYKVGDEVRPKPVDHRARMRNAFLAQGYKGLYTYLSRYMPAAEIEKIKSTINLIAHGPALPHQQTV